MKPTTHFGETPLRSKTPAAAWFAHLVEDVSLAAQVQVRQDAGRPDVGERQAGLRDAGGHQGGFTLAETREEV